MSGPMLIKENKMGTMPIPKLIITTSIPLIFSLFVNQLYNLVDSIFVSHINEEALTGISLAAPIQTIMIALGCGLAVGLNAMISKALGEKREEEVKQTASAAMVMAIVAYFIIVVICMLIVEPYFIWQTGGTASIVNLVLDPILIFGYFGFPALGTAGAAIATVIGQTAGGILGIIFAAIFQGFGNGVYSMYLAFMRQVILLIPFMIVSARMQKLNMFWLTFVIAEMFAIPFGIFLYRRLRKESDGYMTKSTKVEVME